MIDWNECPDVESKPDVMSGTPILRGTRIPAQAIIDNADDGYSPEQIAKDIYQGMPVEPARRLIEFARKARGASAPNPS